MLRSLGRCSVNDLMSGMMFVTDVLFCHCLVHREIFRFGAVFQGGDKY